MLKLLRILSVPNSLQIGRKLLKIRAQLCFLAEMRYGFYSPDFHETRTFSDWCEYSCTEFLSDQKKVA
jgi:hypothetical protein